MPVPREASEVSVGNGSAGYKDFLANSCQQIRCFAQGEDRSEQPNAIGVLGLPQGVKKKRGKTTGKKEKRGFLPATRRNSTVASC